MSNHPSAAELAIECHRLIRRIERHPYNVRLLLGVRQMLEAFAGYKANRSFAHGRKTQKEEKP